MLLPFSAFAQYSLDLSWNPSPDTNVIGYYIYYGVSIGGFTNKISAGNNTTLEISGLSAGVTYYFAATAYDASGDESQPSNEASYYISPPVISTSNLESSSYGGLFYEQDAVRLASAGAFTLSVKANGKYSGMLQTTTARLPFSGTFGSLCQATNYLQIKHTNALVVNFTLKPSNLVVGSVSGGTWMAALYGERMGFHTTTNSPPYPGKYTLLFSGNRAASSSLGVGFGAVSLSASGTVHFAGALADGTKLSQSATVSYYGNWPLYVPLYSGQGLVMGWLTFTNDAGVVPEGTLDWIKSPNPKSALYPEGLAVQPAATGSFYVQGTNPFPPGSAYLGLYGAAAGFGSNQIVSLKFSQGNGTFTGTFKNETIVKPKAFQGAFLQRANSGWGFVLGTNVSSPVDLVP